MSNNSNNHQLTPSNHNVDHRSQAWDKFVQETHNSIKSTPQSNRSTQSAANKAKQLKLGIDVSQVLEAIESKLAVSKPQDESAKQEYSPVAPQGITSFRYEEMKNSNNKTEIKANKDLTRLDSSPERFV